VASIRDTDAAKLHQEINQYINQKLTVINIAITTSSVVLGWVVAGLSEIKGCPSPNVNPVSLLLPTLLLGVLAIILWYIEAINKQMHILSIYLIVRQLSAWEGHYQRFIQTPKAKGMPSRSIQDDMPFIVIFALGIGAMLVFAAAWQASCAFNNPKIGYSTLVFLITAFLWTFFWLWKFKSRHLNAFRRDTEEQWRERLRAEW
jgi:hypothetical protein